MTEVAKGKKRKQVDTDGTKRLPERQRDKEVSLEAHVWNIVIS